MQLDTSWPYYRKPNTALERGHALKGYGVTGRYLYQFHIPNIARNVTPQVLIPTQT